MEILIGTNNKFKQGEMVWFLDELPAIHLHYLDELPEKINVVEDGQTILENAEKKACEISEKTDWLVLTSDAGISIPGLKDKWDMTKPQRLVGEHKTDREKVETLLQIMEGLKGDERFCQFHFALALGHQGQVLWSEKSAGESGVIQETVDDEPIGQSLWMGRAWWYPDLQKTDDRLSAEERQAIREKFRTEMRNRFQKQIRPLINT